MSVASLRLANVRNYVEAAFEPAPGTTVVWGPNGAGKSTLLEGMGVFATLTSRRAGHLGSLVRHGAEEAGLRLDTGGAVLEVRLRGGRAALRVGGSPAGARSFLGRFRCVLFGPEDLDLVRGEPDLRRRALDDLVVQLRPAWRGVRAAFERALRQRNAALRRGQASEAALFDGALAAAAAQVVAARRAVVAELVPHAVEAYGVVAGKGSLGLRYRERVPAEGSTVEELEAWFLRRYREDLPVELERGATRAGPHRDDLEVEVEGLPARSHASRGEQRCAALALRLAELRLLPGAVLLLDDVLSELDGERRERVFEAVGERQTVLTTTEPAAVPAGARVQDRWVVEGGVLRRG